MTILKITAFDVKRCGYYKRKNPLPEFGNLADVLADIKKWVEPKSLSETQTFTPNGEDTLPTYCFDIRKSSVGNNFLLTTWNEVPMAEGGVPVASGKAMVGKVNVDIAEVAEGDIPGFPTYFYFMPESNLLFSIRPQWQKHTGHQGLLRFMRGYIEKASTYVVLDTKAEDVDNKIIGYRNGGTGKVLRLIPSYSSAPKRLPGQVDHLRANRELIRKLIRHDILFLSEKADRGLFGNLLENVGLLDRKVTQQSMSFNYELEFQPTADDLDAVINENETNPDGSSKLGFRMTGSRDIYWLDHAYAKDDIEVKLGPDGSGVLPTADLLLELEKKSQRLLAIAEMTQLIDNVDVEEAAE